MEQVEEVEKHVKIFLDQVSFPHEPSNLIQHIQSCTAIAVTDASMPPDTRIGASSFAIILLISNVQVLHRMEYQKGYK